MSRPGYALVLTLLLLLGLTALGLGVLSAGTREALLAHNLHRTEQARRTAETGVAGALEGWSTRRYSLLPTNAEVPVPVPGDAAVTVRRLGPRLYLVRGTAALVGLREPVRAAAGAVVHAFEAAELAAAAPAAASVETVARVVSGRVASPGGCGEDAGTGVLAPRVQLRPEAVLDGAPPVQQGDPPARPWSDSDFTGLIDALADIRVESRIVRPRPTVRAGECLPGPANWGSVRPEHPCHGLLPLVYAPGPVTVDAGAARGILVVEGDLVLRGTRFEGLIIVLGTLSLEGGATVRGAARAVRLELTDGVVERDVCSLRAALSARALDRPLRPGTRLWVPVF